MGVAASAPIPSERPEKRFRDKNPPLTESEARVESTRCLGCHDAPCIHACPTAIDIPTFIGKIASGNLRGAARTILSANLLGASCARVCPVEVLCEGVCVYVPWGRPAIPIGRLQRYAMEHGDGSGAQGSRLLTKAPPTKKSVGLVGGGPASLACAAKLALLGHDAVIYEKDRWPGGLNTTGVAPYKFQVEDALEEVALAEALGVDIRTGVEVGRDVSPADLLARHDAIFLGIGLGGDSRLGISGRERTRRDGCDGMDPPHEDGDRLRARRRHRRGRDRRRQHIGGRGARAARTGRAARHASLPPTPGCDQGVFSRSGRALGRKAWCSWAA